jgi:hypothetical protein
MQSFQKLIEAAAIVNGTKGCGMSNEFDGSTNLNVGRDTASRTVFLADLPKSTT